MPAQGHVLALWREAGEEVWRVEERLRLSGFGRVEVRVKSPRSLLCVFQTEALARQAQLELSDLHFAPFDRFTNLLSPKQERPITYVSDTRKRKVSEISPSSPEGTSASQPLGAKRKLNSPGLGLGSGSGQSQDLPPKPQRPGQGAFPEPVANMCSFL
jgi:hypothetical protein